MPSTLKTVTQWLNHLPAAIYYKQNWHIHTEKTATAKEYTGSFLNLTAFSHRFLAHRNKPSTSHEYLVIKQVFCGPRQQLHCWPIARAYFSRVEKNHRNQFKPRLDLLKLEKEMCTYMVTQAEILMIMKKSFPMWYKVSLVKHIYSRSDTHTIHLLIALCSAVVRHLLLLYEIPPFWPSYEIKQPFSP